jgi:hypothetical protein
MKHDAARSLDPDEVVMFALDDEDIETDLDVSPLRQDSFVGELPREATLEDHVRGEDEALAQSVARLEYICEAFDSVDPSAGAAETALRKRAGGLAMLSNALRATCAFVLSTEHRELFARGGLLEPYLSDVHMWTGDVTETLTDLARQLNAVAPDWFALRERLENAKWIHAHALVEHRKLDRIKDTLPDDLRAAVDELFIAFACFTRDLDEPFG